MADQRLTNFLVLFGTFFLGDVYIIDWNANLEAVLTATGLIMHGLCRCDDIIIAFHRDHQTLRSAASQCIVREFGRNRELR
jgi:hypothetical protein